MKKKLSRDEQEILRILEEQKELEGKQDLKKAWEALRKRGYDGNGKQVV